MHRWLLLAAWLVGAASVEDEVVVFLAVRSKGSNARLRSVLRRTWLSPRRGLGYRFFSDSTGCCADERDVVVRDATWTHREFELIYPPSMDLKQSAWSGMYSRDWELNCAAWAVRFARFRFIAHTDDDAFVCARSMVEILGALPVPTRGLVLGWNRRDAFDNCLVLVSRDVADYFALYYYEKLRPAQIRNGVTYGSGWSASKGDWRARLVEDGVPLLFRQGFNKDRGVRLVDHHTYPDVWPRTVASVYLDAEMDAAVEASPGVLGFGPRVNTWARYREKLQRLTTPAEKLALATESAAHGRERSDFAPPADPRGFCRGRLHFDKFKSEAVLDWFWRKVAAPGGDATADAAAAKDAAAYLLYNGRAAPAAPTRYAESRVWDATRGWRNGTWYDALGVDTATVPARVAATYAAPPPKPPPAPDVDGAAVRRRTRWPRGPPELMRDALWRLFNARACARATVAAACAASARRKMPCDRCLPWHAGIDPRDDWVDKPLNRRPAPPPHAPDDEALVVPPHAAPCAGSPRAPPAQKRYPWLLFARKHRAASAAGAAALARAAALSAALNAPSLFPIVVYLHHGRRDVEDDFTRFLDALGVAWLPHRLSFADELPADLRDVPLHSFAWIDAAALLEALGPELEERGVGDGRRALVTSAGVQFAGDVKLGELTFCAERRAACHVPGRPLVETNWGTKRCCGDAAGAVVAVGTEAAGTENLGGELDAAVLMILDAPRLAAMRADVLDLARRRRWRVPDERDLMVEWFVPGRGGPVAYYDDSAYAARAFAHPMTFPPRDARIWLWDRTTPEDVLCWRRGNYTPALNLVVNNIAARNVRTNLGCPQKQLMHGCATRTYAALLDDHLALLEAAEALAPRGARR